MKLQTRFSLANIALVTLAALGISTITVLSERRSLEKENQNHHEQVAAQLSGVCVESLYQSNPIIFANFVQSLKTERGFLAAGFIDSAGRLHLHSDPAQIGASVDSPHEKQAGSSNQIFHQRYTDSRGQRVLDISAPVFVGEERVGTARLWIAVNAVERFLNQASVQHVRRLGLITAVVLFLSYLLAVALARALASPIQQTVQGMKEVSEGRRDPLPFQHRNDELGSMQKQLNATIVKLKELDEMKESFVAGITHDLKSPLSAIEGFVTRLSAGLGRTSEEKQRDYFLIILNNSRRLMRLIDDLLLSARLEARREELNARVSDVRVPVEEALKLYSGIAREKKLELRYERPQEPVLAFIDRDKVIHIMNNLVSNAIKYTTHGFVKVEIQSGDDHVQIRVSDSGSGIPKEERAKIFERFYRSRSNAGQAKGTGLGLAIVKGLVEAHGGTIAVEDHAGPGTRIAFTLRVNSPFN